MSNIGVSTACFYPLETEFSLKKVVSLGIHRAELFFNSPSEIMPPFITDLKESAKEGGVEIVSVHPFSSFTESNFLFSSYKRRYTDTLPLYERFVEVTSFLGAKIFVIHGARLPGSVSDEEYCERFSELIEMGKKYGVNVCQENVVNHRAQTTDYLVKMSKLIGKDFGIVLDIKQARRAGTDDFELIEKLSPFIKHVHISDYNDCNDCIAPCNGKYDFYKLFSTLKNKGYNGDYIIELYKNSYENDIQIINSYQKLTKILNLI